MNGTRETNYGDPVPCSSCATSRTMLVETTKRLNEANYLLEREKRQCVEINGWKNDAERERMAAERKLFAAEGTVEAVRAWLQDELAAAEIDSAESAGTDAEVRREITTLKRVLAKLGAAGTPTPRGFDFQAHLQRQREWSERTFGPGNRTAGVIDHIRKELNEIERAPEDLSEWADVVILGLDGFWRAGASTQQIIDAIVAKQTKNEARTWPDWRTQPLDKAIEHDRSADTPAAPPAGTAEPPPHFDVALDTDSDDNKTGYARLVSDYMPTEEAEALAADLNGSVAAAGTWPQEPLMLASDYFAARRGELEAQPAADDTNYRNVTTTGPQEPRSRNERELDLIRRAAQDTTLSDAAVRHVALGLAQITHDDLEWAYKMLTPATPTRQPPRADDEAVKRALSNCYMMAKRELSRITNGKSQTDATSLERWQHVKRFCESAGETSSILRWGLPTELTDGQPPRAEPPQEKS
jgi:hypothetical protein